MKNVDANFFENNTLVLHKKEYLHSSNEKAIHVGYNVNNSFFSQLGASIVSIIENNKDLNFVFHIFTDGYSTANGKKVEELARKWKCSCILYEMNMDLLRDFHIKVKRFSKITYARICMPKILSTVGGCDRLLYIDADTMCIGNIKNLVNIDLKNRAMGAVSEREDAVSYRAGHLHLKSDKYFNDGVMLIDIKEWEKQHITEKAFSYQNEPGERFIGHDQDIMNLVFDGKNYFLPSKYNVYDGGEYDKGDSIIIHWTGRRKPWQMVVSKFDEQWRLYNEMSPWETITNVLPVKKPENYHDFQQWGRYQKKLGNYMGYIKGILWYSWLRLRYKCKL